jgi:hypothetical protein
VNRREFSVGAAKRNEEELPYCRMVGHWLSNVIPPFIGSIS